jgi:hypothetical protein
VLAERDLQVFGLDNNCQHLRHLDKQLGQPHKYSPIIFATGELHGSSHVPSCQLSNLIHFKEGCGRPVLEQSEQAWAQLKYAVKAIRCVGPILPSGQCLMP